MTRTKRGEHPHRSEQSFRKPTFFSDRVDLATVPDGPSASVQAIHSNAVSSEVARNSYAVHWKGNPQPWRWMCRDGSPAVDDAAMIEREERAKAVAEADDAGSVMRGVHSERLRGYGLRVEFLLAFTRAHNCWEWPTWRVQRDLIKPATEGRGRCRYAELREATPYTGPATVFISHCWGASWGSLVMAACVGARRDRVVWIDLFAVRQWPGNGEDLDFRGVIRGCTALLVAAPVIAGEISRRFVAKDERAISNFLASDEGGAAKKQLFSFRLWCVVELHSALAQGIPVIVSAGEVVRESDAVVAYRTYTKSTHFLLQNLERMLDVESAECAVAADYDREMALVRAGVGVETVQRRVAGALLGAFQVAQLQALELNAAVCGEPEALQELPRGRIEEALSAAAAGGRDAAVKLLLARGMSEESVEAPITECDSYAGVSWGYCDDDDEQTPNLSSAVPAAMDLASKGGHAEVVALLRQYGARRAPGRRDRGDASPSYDEDTRPAQCRRPGTPQPGPAEAAAAGNFCIPAVPGAASADFFIDDEGRRVDLGNEDGGSDEDLSYVGD